tara:strand:- start:17821 stop:18051 length:231 start_codon:yes stop_codon:yes gene_type:complete
MLYGKEIFENPNLTIQGPDRRRTIKERLFSRPWRPFVASEPTRIPDPSVYASDKAIFAHPETARKMKDLIAAKAQK